MTTKQRKTVAERISAAVRERFPMPERIAFLREIAHWDLWHGPVSAQEDSPYNPDPARVTPATWPGFSEACAEMATWLDETLSGDLYWDDDCECLMDKEPESWQDESTGEWIDPSEYYLVDRREIRKALFPAQLSDYIGQ